MPGLKWSGATVNLPHLVVEKGVRVSKPVNRRARPFSGRGRIAASSVLSLVMAAAALVVAPVGAVAAPHTGTTLFAADANGEPVSASGNFIPGTLTLEPGPGWSSAGGYRYYETSLKQVDGTYCFVIRFSLSRSSKVAVGGERKDEFTLCGPPGTISPPITLLQYGGYGVYTVTQGPVYITIGEYDVRPCAPRMDGPEYEAAMASAVVFEGNVGDGGRWDPQYFPKTKWAYLDIGLGSCDANERVWYLVPVAEGAGKGFVVSDYFETCTDTDRASYCTEKFNGKSYDLLNKSVRKKMRCRNVGLFPPAPTLAQTRQENPNIQDQYVLVRRKYVDGEPAAYESSSGLNDALCYKAPKSAGSHSFVRQSGWEGESAADRWETWCNIFLFCVKKFQPGWKSSGFDAKSTTKFVFKQESVSAKKTNVKFKKKS